MAQVCKEKKSWHLSYIYPSIKQRSVEDLLKVRLFWFLYQWNEPVGCWAEHCDSPWVHELQVSSTKSQLAVNEHAPSALLKLNHWHAESPWQESRQWLALSVKEAPTSSPRQAPLERDNLINGTTMETVFWLNWFLCIQEPFSEIYEYNYSESWLSND